MELDANIFKNFISLWYLPLELPNETWNYPMKHFLFLPTVATVAMITFKMFLPIFIAAVVRKTYSSIKIMQPLSSNYNWENGVKQIKITEEYLSQSCILCQLLRTKTLVSGSECIKHFFQFYHYLPYICWVDVIYLTCLAFLKSPWWLV